VREDYWEATLVRAKRKRPAHYSKGTNIVLAGNRSRSGKVSVHIYDSDGKLSEEPDSWEKGHLRLRTSFKDYR